MTKDADIAVELDPATHTKFAPHFNPSSALSSAARPDGSQVIWDLIEVIWPLEDKYLSGVVVEVSKDGAHFVAYDNTNMENFNMGNEIFQYALSRPLNPNASAFIATLGSN